MAVTRALMRHDRWDIKARPAWIRVGLILYLLSAVLLVSVHQHPAGPTSHDCAICAAAHTPLVTPSVAVLTPRLVVSLSPPPIASERPAESGFTRTNSSRAPPQA